MKLFDFIEEVKPGREKPISKGIVDFSTDLFGSAREVASGTVNTVSDLADGVKKLSEGDLDSALKIANNGVKDLVKGTVGMVESGMALTNSAVETITTGKLIENVKIAGEKTTSKDIVDFATDVFGSAKEAASGAVNTVSDLADGLNRLSKEDFDCALNSANNRVQDLVKGTVGIVESGVALTNSAVETITTRNRFECVKPEGAETTLEDIAGFVTDVVIGSATGVVSGAVNTVGDVANGVNKLSEGDFSGAFTIASNRVQNMVKGSIGIVESGVSLTSSAAESITTGKTFITPENKANLTKLCTVGIYTTIGSGMFLDDTPTGSICPGGDVCNLPGIENGVFHGDSADLNSLIQAGEIDGTEHVSAPIRSDMARSEFLDSHGITDTDGWEVHHVVPISEGGLDEPGNMVLIKPEDHDEITREHAGFYGWHKKSEE